MYKRQQFEQLDLFTDYQERAKEKLKEDEALSRERKLQMCIRDSSDAVDEFCVKLSGRLKNIIFDMEYSASIGMTTGCLLYTSRCV